MQITFSLTADGFSQEEYDDIVLCLQTLLAVRAGEQPLARDLGLDYDSVSLPEPLAINQVTLDITEKVRIYEPRVRVDRVEALPDHEGKLALNIYFKEAY